MITHELLLELNWEQFRDYIETPSGIVYNVNLPINA